MSFALGILKSEVVTVVAVVDFYLTGAGNGKSLAGSLVCFDFSHFIYSFSVIALFIKQRQRRYRILIF